MDAVATLERLDAEGLEAGAVDFAHPRGLDRRVFEALQVGGWVGAGDNVVVTGPAGIGKTYLACALGSAARAAGYSTRYCRLSPLVDAIESARAGGTHRALQQQLARTDLLVLDEWGLASFSYRELRDLIDVLDDRRRRSVVLVSHVPVEAWYDFVGDPALAATFVDRMGRCEHAIALTGTSMRPRRPIAEGPRPRHGQRAKLLVP